MMIFSLQDVHDSQNGAFRRYEGLLRAKRTEKYGVEGLVLSLLGLIAGPIQAECGFLSKVQLLCLCTLGAPIILGHQKRSCPDSCPTGLYFLLYYHGFSRLMFYVRGSILRTKILSAHIRTYLVSPRHSPSAT